MMQARNALRGRATAAVAPALLTLLSCAPVHGQTVTFADVDKALIEANVERQQVVRRDGREFPVRIESAISIVIGPGNKIQHTWTPTSHSPGGTKRAAPGRACSRSISPATSDR